VVVKDGGGLAVKGTEGVQSAFREVMALPTKARHSAAQVRELAEVMAKRGGLPR
jgi:hypothetical protein